MGAMPLSGMRAIMCGKGGGGKSTITALMAGVLTEKGYEVHVLDGDPSNPGLYRMLGFEEAPESLLVFFGGTVFTGGKVTCPVDDPFPLPGGKIDLNEIPDKYFKQRKGITFFRTGKIQVAFEGCDGPEDKIARDFIVPGAHVTLIDIKAGLEHFGRGVEINCDGIITVVDPNVISFEIADRVKGMVEGIMSGVLPAVSHLEDPEQVAVMIKLAKSAKLKYAWTILNKVDSEETELVMTRELGKRGIEPIGSVRNDPEIFKSGLENTAVRESGAKKDVEKIVNRLEENI